MNNSFRSPVENSTLYSWHLVVRCFHVDETLKDSSDDPRAETPNCQVNKINRQTERGGIHRYLKLCKCLMTDYILYNSFIELYRANKTSSVFQIFYFHTAQEKLILISSVVRWKTHLFLVFLMIFFLGRVSEFWFRFCGSALRKTWHTDPSKPSVLWHKILERRTKIKLFKAI